VAEELLAEREVSGYPGVTAQLYVYGEGDPDGMAFSRVVITDAEGATEFDNPDAYLHPFAFGYGLTPSE
jgi:hypothetical protein